MEREGRKRKGRIERERGENQEINKPINQTKKIKMERKWGNKLTIQIRKERERGEINNHTNKNGKKKGRNTN